MEIDKHLETVKAQFSELNKNIAELDKRRVELTEQLDSKNISVKDIQDSAVLKVELDLITQGLTKARSLREQEIKSYQDRAWREVGDIIHKDLAAEKKKHEHLHSELFAAIDSLRSAYAHIREEERKAEAILWCKIRELSALYPVRGIVATANFMPSRETMSTAEAIRYNNLVSALKEDYRDETITT